MNLEELLKEIKIEPRPYQKRVINRTIKHFSQDNLDSILIESPCGSGKTVMGLAACKLLQTNFGYKIGWIAMRRNLLSQAERENVEKGFNCNLEFISMFDKNPPVGLDMLVIDEAQHDSTASCAHIHNLIKPKKILGLSATPYRADRVKLCFSKVIKDAGLRILIREGWLAKFEHFTIPEWTVETVCKFYLAEKERWGKTIMYFHRVQDCLDAKQDLARSGLCPERAVEVVTGNSNREEQLEKFRKNEVNILLNCMVLTEGFDEPQLQTVFCRPSGKGTTIQMCGRAFRKHPNIKFKNIVQSQGTKWPFIKTADPLMQHIWTNNEWRSLKVNEKIGLMQRNILLSIAKINVTMPKLIEEVRAKKRKRRVIRG
jgi:superfamily II DNA or RNA helicase